MSLCSIENLEGACGVGECINAKCLCNNGWSTSREFEFFADVSSANGTLCTNNEVAHYILYSIVALFSFSLMVFLGTTIKKKTSLRRSIPLFFGLGIHFIYSVTKLGDPSKLYGYDIMISILLGLTGLAETLVYIIAIRRYIAHFKGKILMPEEKFIAVRIKITQRIIYFIILIGVSASLCAACVSATENQHTKKVLFKVFLSLKMIMFLCSTTAMLLLFGPFVKSVENIMDQRKSRRASPNRGLSGSLLYRRLAKSLPQLRKRRVLVIFIPTVCFLAIIPPLVSDIALSSFKLIYPGYLLISELLTLRILVQDVKIRIKRERKTTATSQISSMYAEVERKPFIRISRNESQSVEVGSNPSV